MFDVWLHGFPVPGRTEAWAEQVEHWTFDGVLMADSQNLVGDPFVELALAARVTSRLGLGTGVINPRTRHAAVAAAAIATLQIESGGRALLGVGRGDSALAQIGLAETTTTELTGFLDQVTGYLSGRGVELAGRRSSLAWLPTTFEPPPLEVAATGRRTIAIAATRADRVALTVGAEPGRVAEAVAVARRARTDADMGAADGGISAYLNIACHADPAAARQLVRGSAAIFARFSGLNAHTGSGQSDAVIHEATRRYTVDEHGLSTQSQSGALDGDFLDRFAIAGDPQKCVARLQQLLDVGVDRLILVPCSRDSDPVLVEQSNELIAREVLPALRAAAAG